MRSETLSLLRFRLLKALLIAALLCAKSNIAHAQRGKSVNEEVSNNRTPSYGLPGFFDTEVVQKNNFTLEIPTFAIDYGVTDRFTVGLNAITPLTTTLYLSSRESSGSPVLLLKTRYRIFTTHGWESTLTAHVLGANASLPSSLEGQKQTKRVRVLAGTLNTSKHLGNHQIGSSAIFANMSASSGRFGSAEQQDDQEYQIAFAAWWRHQFLENFETELLAAVCPFSKRISTNPGLRLEISSSCLGKEKFDPGYRGFLNWRSSRAWLWTIGVVSLPTGTIPVYPYLGFNYVLDTSSIQHVSDENQALKEPQ